MLRIRFDSGSNGLAASDLPRLIMGNVVPSDDSADRQALHRALIILFERESKYLEKRFGVGTKTGQTREFDTQIHFPLSL